MAADIARIALESATWHLKDAHGKGAADAILWLDIAERAQRVAGIWSGK
jgi:hypothetical protein